MPRNIIQNLLIVVWLIITLRTIIAIIQFNRKDQKENLRNRKYTHEEIEEDQETSRGWPTSQRSIHDINRHPHGGYLERE